MTGKIRIAIIVTHPIQYYVPLYRALSHSGAFELIVFYASRIGIDRFHDPKMGVDVKWRMDLLSGYQSVFLPDADHIKALSFWGVNNPKVGSALLRFKPEVVLIHGYAVATAIKALAWARLNGVPVIMTSDSSTNANSSWWRVLGKKLIMPILLQQFTAFLTMSDRSEEYLASFGVARSRMFRVPMLLDNVFWTVRARRVEERALIRAELGINEDELAIAYVGKLYPGKRVYDLIDAIAKIQSDLGKRPRLRLIVVGDGEQRVALEKLATVAKVSASFVGFINIHEIPRFYALSDILVHPAELEQYGMVVVEAATVGLPLVMSDRVGAVGPTSIARHGENAIVYPCGNVGALTDAIRRLIDLPNLRASMGEGSLRISLDHAGPKSVAGVLAAANSCLAGRNLAVHA